MKLKRIKIKELYGCLNYDIKVDYPVQIITGLNENHGSAILVGITGMCTKHHLPFPFDVSKITLTFDEGTAIRDTIKNRSLTEYFPSSLADKLSCRFIFSDGVFNKYLPMKSNVVKRIIKNERFDYLLEILKDKFHRNVTVDLSSECVKFIDHVTDRTYDSLHFLSIGELKYYEILYTLLFLVKKGSIVMIGAPECYLHVTLQDDLVDYIEEICKVRSLQALIYTHSPIIVGGRWKESYDLTENSKIVNNKDDNFNSRSIIEINW